MNKFIAHFLSAVGFGIAGNGRIVAAGNGAPGILVPDSGIRKLERANWSPSWTIEKFESDLARILGGSPFEVSEIPHNLLVNEGIAEMWDLIIGAAGTPFNNANARIGVGDSTTAAAAGQTGLQAATNSAFVGMEAGYPARTNQTVDWRSVFDGSTGNFAWQEFTIVNAATDAGDNLNRLVSAQGTKASGQSWTVTLSVTLS